MNINEYINDKYDGAKDWFIKETNSYFHTRRINNVLKIKEYLNGKHKIMEREGIVYKGEVIEPKKILLQYAKTIVEFQVSYLCKNPISLTGDDATVKKMNKVYKRGKFHRMDRNILESIIKFGDAYEYLYFDENGDIKSKLIKCENSYPIYDDFDNYVGFIEHFETDYVSYWNVYYEDRVEKWSNRGGNISLREEPQVNLSGLPIPYRNKHELFDNCGKSELEDIIPIIDMMEDLLSKFADVTHMHCNPIIVISSQVIPNSPISKDATGIGYNLEDGGSLMFAQPKLDVEAFKATFDKLMETLLDLSCTPAVSMNKTDISNLSEVTVQMLFTLADLRASMNEQFLRDGIDHRFDIIRKMLAMKGIVITEDGFDSLGFTCITSKPRNEKEIIENINSMYKEGLISLQTALEKSPLVYDVQRELSRIESEHDKAKAQMQITPPTINQNDTGTGNQKDVQNNSGNVLQK